MTHYALKLSSIPHRSGSSSGVERKLPKLDVAGSIPVSRSIFYLQRITSSAICLLVAGLLAACGGQQLAQQSPLDTPENHYRRGLAYLDRGDMITAQREFERARLLDSDYPGALVGIALVAMERGNFWRARKDVTTAIHRDADFVDAHIALGRIATAEGIERDYATEKWLEEATAAYERAAKRRPDYPATYYYRGHSHLLALDLPGAREAFTRVLNIDQGPLVSPAMAAVGRIQMIERAAPGTRTGLKIALISEISRGELAVLLVEEMQLPLLVSQRPVSLRPGRFRPPGAVQVDMPTPTDIDNSWAAPWIGEVIELGVAGMELFPDQTFRPSSPITRADYARVVQGVLILLTGDTELATRYVGESSRFPDVRSDFYGYNAIALSTQRGIMSAEKVSGLFRPEQPVSGAEALLMMRELQSLFRREF